jgi:hypothetical protein
MAIEKELLDRLLADYKKPEDLIGETGLLKQLTKALLERALQAELTDHLGHENGRCQERCRFFLSDLSLACRMTLGRFLRVQGDHLHPAPITAGTGPPLRTVGFGSLVNRSSLA